MSLKLNSHGLAKYMRIVQEPRPFAFSMNCRLLFYLCSEVFLAPMKVRTELSHELSSTIQRSVSCMFSLIWKNASLWTKTKIPFSCIHSRVFSSSKSYVAPVEVLAVLSVSTYSSAVKDFASASLFNIWEFYWTPNATMYARVVMITNEIAPITSTLLAELHFISF